MNLPVPGRITQYFGPTNEKLDGPAFGFPHFNKGIDIAADAGTDIRNIVKGTVIWVGDAGDNWGVSVKVKMDDGRIVNYGHMLENSPTVRIGQRLNGGEIIGKVGSTGASTGPHLSFDVFGPDGTPADPSDILGFNARIDNRTGQPWGGSGMSSGAGSNPSGFLFQKPNPEVLNALKKQRDALWKQIEKLMGKDDEDSQNQLTLLLAQWQDLTTQIDVYERTGYFTMADAMTAFSNAVQLGSLDLSKAAQLFTEWQQKESAARAAAEAQIRSAVDFNAWADAKRKEASYGYNWRPTMSMVPASFDDAYKRWAEKFNVGEPPSSEGIDVLKYMPDQSTSVAQTVPYNGQLPESPHISGPAAGLLDKFLQQLKDVSKEVSTKYSTSEPVVGGKKWSDLSLKEKLALMQTNPQVAKQGWKWEAANSPQTSQTPFDDYPQKGWSPAPNLGPVKPQAGAPSGFLDPTKASYPEDRYRYELRKEPDWLKELRDPKTKKKKPWWKRLPGLAAGGQNIPPGMYAVGEQGPETVVGPGGEMAIVGQDGPQVAQFNQPGFDVLPADVPPEQAYLYAKFKRIAQEDAASSEGKQLMEQQERANDPQLDEKVKQAIVRAVISILAANPPATPVLKGSGWDRDPWEHLRPLTGIGPDGKPITQSSGLPVMGEGMPQVPGVPGVAPGVQLKGASGGGIA